MEFQHVVEGFFSSEEERRIKVEFLHVIEGWFANPLSPVERYYTNLLLENEGLGFPSIEEAKQDLRAALTAATRGF